MVQRRHRREGDRGVPGVRVFGIDPGSDRTGYGCIETDGSRHRLVVCGAIAAAPRAEFPDKLLAIYRGLGRLLGECRPDCVAVESLFYATNVRSALKLGHARGVAVLAAVEGGYRPGRVHPGRDQARGGGLRPGREAPGPRDGAPAARPGRGARAERRGRRAGRGHLPRAHVGGAPREVQETCARTRKLPRSWREYRP